MVTPTGTLPTAGSPRSAVPPKALDAYYASLVAFQQQGVTHEQAIRLAFATLLDTGAKNAGWTLVQEQRLANRRRPDATLYDAFRLPRGYWEAKDTHDDLDAEIRKKIAVGYPTTNIIFEDSRRAVLFQNNRPAFEADLTQRPQLLSLLDRYFAYTGAQIKEFHHAVQEFKDRIPELARGLMTIVEQERTANKPFVAAFARFHDLCRKALDPAITPAAIEEMLVQHLLTERLFRTVFETSDFTRRNVIASEIEKVVDALTSRAFNRQAFLKSLDYFYRAIEDAARTIEDWLEKQGFLNTVYERFFQGFSQKQADTHGIVYTPQPIVDFMCASVEEVLKNEFGTSLSEPGVKILDPCVGTGNFMVNILRRIEPRHLKRKYAEDLFCNEVMLLPYYIASLNIEHAYLERTGEYSPFEGISFADTLDLAEHPQLSFFSEANTDRVERQKVAHITVIIGNPPYNVGQQNENDNNKNRKYPVVDQRIKATYGKDSSASTTIKLYDPYVRFFRWATDRLQGRDGIVCFVSNNSFVDQNTFDGMRKHLMRDFTTVYHLNLRGNVRQNPKLTGTAYNVFGIQLGVGITIAVKKQGVRPALYYAEVPLDWRRLEKLVFLTKCGALTNILWKPLTPDTHNTWLTERLGSGYDDFLPIGTKEAKAIGRANASTIFRTYSLGVSTNRDDVLYDFDRQRLEQKVCLFLDAYNAEVHRWRIAGQPRAVDSFVRTDAIKWSEGLKNQLRRLTRVDYSASHVRIAQYRPFCQSFLYYDRQVVERPRLFSEILPTPATEAENQVIWVKVGTEVPAYALMIHRIPDLLPQGGSQCFPLYTYAEDGTNRRDNITEWSLAEYQTRYGSAVTKRDIFHYVYALLHHPDYRSRYAENLKRELPRIPFIGDAEEFRVLVASGERLAQLHLYYEQQPEYKLDWIQNRAAPWSWRVEKMRLSPDKTTLIVNRSLTLAGIPPEAFNYRLGNRSALEWVIDQYQVRTDSRSGITSDPNRPDDEEYIARLVGRVITVSLETVKCVATFTPLALHSPT